MTNSELKIDINSESPAIISKALEYISEYGKPEILPELIVLLQNNDNESIKNQLINIFENLHDQNALPYIINALSDTKNQKTRGILVSTCWKNSLNFDNHVELFLDIFIKGDFNEAFDALTIIDNMRLITEENANKCILKLENYLENANNLKKPIVCELIKIIQSHTKNPAE